MNRADRFVANMTGIKRGPSARAGTLLAFLLLAFPMLYAQTPAPALQGQVLNGTTNRPLPNVKVEYVLLQQGMVPVAAAVTDAEGRFHFAGVQASGDSPALLRTEYQGATYSRPVLPQKGPAAALDIQVFEAGRQPSMISAKEHAIFLHPAGDTLLVLE